MSGDTTDGLSSGLFQSERQRAILSMTVHSGRVEVAELAERFGVTTETIRRDLSDLQRQRVVRRVHGGAIPWETDGFEPRFLVRAEHNEAEKRRIARIAVKQLPDTGSIIIDSGSTLTRFAETIPADCALRIVTNSLPAAQVLADHEGLEIVVIGGQLRKNTLAMVDAETVAAVQPLAVEVLFISSDGLSAERGLTTPYSEEATLKRAMIKSARRVIALVDHSKFGRNHFIRFAEWSEIDVLVTTIEADPATIAAIESLGTTVLLA